MSKSSVSKLTAISLFASSGIGDLALRASGGEVLVANEFRSDRAELFERNYPETKMFCGDIRELGKEITSETLRRLEGRELDVLFATPPCQGMSKNGRGKLLQGVREGFRDVLDPRNQLATFVPPIVSKLKPKVVVFENVPEMLGTLVEDKNGELVELVGYLSQQMKGYEVNWKVVEFANYGVPQRRQRLITVFVRKDIANGLNNLVERIFAN
jgi:DNA (cytosine-5)-methyltransferase 1